MGAADIALTRARDFDLAVNSRCFGSRSVSREVFFSQRDRRIVP